MSDDRFIGLAPGAPLEAAGQDERKYQSRNFVVRTLINKWLDKLKSVVPVADGALADIGVGEALALERIAPTAPLIIGIDYRPDKLGLAKSRVPGLLPAAADAGMLPLPSDRFDVVLCIEVLEHLLGPERAVSELARICKDACVVSVPWEPFFRLGNLVQGKNAKRFGNDPEHVQQFSPRRLKKLLGASFADVTIHRRFPWIIAVARGSRPTQ